MGNKELQKRLQKLVPFLSKLTASSAVALVVLATIEATLTNAVASGLSVALVGLLSSVFGDVVASPVIERLMSGKLKEDELEGQLQQFLELLDQQMEVSQEVRQMLNNQNSFVAAVGVALEINKTEIIHRLLRGISHHQKLGADQVVERLSTQLGAALQRIDPETAYLLDLVKRVNRGGVLRYVSVPLATDSKPTSTKNYYSEELRLPSLFTVYEHNLRSSDDPALQTSGEKQFTDISQVIEHHPRFVLKGKPGVGKTTAIQKAVLDNAWLRLNAPNTTPLPVLLNLSTWEDNQSLRNFIQQNILFVVNPQELMTTGDIATYIDETDQMGVRTTEHDNALKEWFSSSLAPKLVIIARRSFDVTYPHSDHYDEKFQLPIVRLEELERKHIEAFAYSFLKDDAKNFLSQIFAKTHPNNDQRRLSKLAKTPFLLTALVVMYFTLSKRLPKNQGKLFQGLVGLLWDREQQFHAHSSAWVDQARMVEYLASLAFYITQNNLASTLSFHDALSFVPSTEFLEIAQAANLVEIDSNKVRFSHQLIQDYFCAIELRRRKIEIPRQYSLDDYKRFFATAPFAGEIVGASAMREGVQWDQVYVAYSGLLPSGEANSFVSKALEQNNPWVAALCIASGTTTSDYLLQTTVRKLLEFESVVSIGETGFCMMELGERAVTTLHSELKNSNPKIRMATASFLGDLGNDDTIPLLNQAASHAEKQGEHQVMLSMIGAREMMRLLKEYNSKNVEEG